MTSKAPGLGIGFFACCVMASLAVLPAAVVLAQTAGELFSRQQPELSRQFDAAYVVQARVFENIAAIDNSRAARNARDEFEKKLQMRANMSMAEMMAMMRMQSNMRMPGPFDEWEVSVSSEMMELLRSRSSSAEILGAYRESPLPGQVIEVIRQGRNFKNRVYDILANNSIADKQNALDEAARSYRSSEASVPLQPKSASLLLEHPQAGAFADGYPKLSSLLWSTQWLQLATIEAMILQEQDTQYWGSVDFVRERFQNKMTNSERSRSPLPVEIPMAPAIAPALFSLSPETAIILDNLTMFETVVADVLTYPNLEDKSARLNAIVAEFTNAADNLDPTIDYLVSALRGGIYNQGGPAIGDLSGSERNRSRMEMGMQHAMVMSSP